MAQKRMFAKTIIDSDAFLDMSSSTQNLYFHLGMRADDDGFINNPKMIMRIINSSEDDMKVLILKKFILPLDNGIIVIKHWKINNYIQSDRYTPTKYQEQLAKLGLDENKAYTYKDDSIQDVYIMDTQVREVKSKISIDKNSKEEDTHTKHKYGTNKNVLLTKEEYNKLIDEGLEEYIENLSFYIASKKVSYKSHYMTILSWKHRDDKKKHEEEKPKFKTPKGVTTI